jgi:uncharacterized membrane protein YciS (DUF1049 family)
MLPFAGFTDPKAYLDWEIVVEQKFNSHLVPKEHRVRLLLLVSLLVLLFSGGMIFAMMLMPIAYLKLGLRLNVE